MKNKVLRITLITVVALMLLVICLLAGVKLGERILFAKFYFNASTEFKTPGVSDGFIQQGFDFVEEENVYLTSGYMKDGSSSRVYITSKDGKTLGFTKLRNQTGGRNDTHAGGIAHYGEFVYVCNGSGSNGIEVFRLSDILSKNEARCIGTIDLGIAPAFVYVDKASNTLYSGNFHKDETVYLSPEEYKMTTPAGDSNTALIGAYDLDPNAKATFGVKDENAEIVYSIPSKVQGMLITPDNKLVLTTSWGVSKSHLLIYDFAKINEKSDKTTRALGYTAPLYFVDSANLVKDVKAPPMAEEVVYMDGKIYIMNESASAKYIFGKFTSGNYVNAYIYE